MLHKMSEVRGWTHEEMLGMEKRTFSRYYGYWYAEKLLEKQKMDEIKRKDNQENKDWKTI